MHTSGDHVASGTKTRAPQRFSPVLTSAGLSKFISTAMDGRVTDGATTDRRLHNGRGITCCSWKRKHTLILWNKLTGGEEKMVDHHELVRCVDEMKETSSCSLLLLFPFCFCQISHFAPLKSHRGDNFPHKEWKLTKTDASNRNPVQVPSLGLGPPPGPTKEEFDEGIEKIFSLRMNYFVTATTDGHDPPEPRPLVQEEEGRTSGESVGEILSFLCGANVFV